MNDDLEILTCLKNSKLLGVRYLCSRYGEGMTIVAFRSLRDMEKAKDLVYETFWKLWAEKKFSDVTPPLRPFLYQEVKKACNAVKLPPL
jgi:DNA-directed RNA polymerase specialized sigma24 family protein